MIIMIIMRIFLIICWSCFCQDPDVINTPLPVEYGPTSEDDGVPVIRPSDHTSTSLTPLLVSRPISHNSSSQLGLPSLGPSSTPVPPQPTKPRLLLQRTHPVHHEVTSCCEVLEPSWAEPVPAPGSSRAAGMCAGGHWLQPEPPFHRPSSRNGSSSGSQKLKNKTKNLWNPTYGSWVLENFRGKKTLAHTQSMPLSTSTSSNTHTCSPTSEGTDSGSDNSNSTHLSPSNLCTSSTPSPSCQTQATPNTSSHKTPAGGNTKAAMDLAKLQSFPCGNVNYAYDEPSYEAESLPLVVPKAPEAITNTSSTPSVSSGTGLGLALGLHTSSSYLPKLLLKRHASYGHEDVKRHTKAEKPTRDRDSGFSLSEDLSVTPI